MIAFDHSYAALPPSFYRKVLPTPVSGPRLIRFNAALAGELGLDAEALADPAAAEIWTGNRILPDANPIATAYAAHQFGHFVPQLGDGRAILLGEVIDKAGQRRDIQLKGAGPTPFSRNGDGRAALGPVLREYIVSEAMHALGIPTTRALAAALTGEEVYRETRLPGAVLTRVAASHIRIGTFQFFAARGEREALAALMDHVIDRHYPALRGAENPALALIDAVAARQASLVARWMGIGFIHGVMNTDNMAISGETIDYGPCAFLDEFDPNKVFSSIDRQGRYAYRNQPAIAQWNLARLAETLLDLIDPDEARAAELATASLDRFAQTFNAEWAAVRQAKLGLMTIREEDEALWRWLSSLMTETGCDHTLFFRALTHVAAGSEDGANRALIGDSDSFGDWLSAWRERLALDGAEADAARAATMSRANPAAIPRNHQVEAAISAAVGGDFTHFHAMVDALADPFTDRPDLVAWQQPPEPAERVTKTFCGT